MKRFHTWNIKKITNNGTRKKGVNPKSNIYLISHCLNKIFLLKIGKRQVKSSNIRAFEKLIRINFHVSIIYKFNLIKKGKINILLKY